MSTSCSMRHQDWPIGGTVTANRYESGCMKLSQMVITRSAAQQGVVKSQNSHKVPSAVDIRGADSCDVRAQGLRSSPVFLLAAARWQKTVFMKRRACEMLRMSPNSELQPFLRILLSCALGVNVCSIGSRGSWTGTPVVVIALTLIVERDLFICRTSL